MIRAWVPLAFAVVLLGSATASADVIPMYMAECMDKARGDACDIYEDEFGEGSIGLSSKKIGRGTCQPATCFRNDYSQGSPPREVEYDCLQCAKPEAKAAMEEKASKAEPQPSAEAKTEPVDAPASAEKASGGCRSGSRRAPLASVGLGVVLLALARRRVRGRNTREENRLDQP